MTGGTFNAGTGTVTLTARRQPEHFRGRVTFYNFILAKAPAIR